MTTGEWSCLISFAWDPLSCLEQAGIEKNQSENIYFQRDSNPRQDTASETALWTARQCWLDIKWGIYSLTV